MADLSGDAFVKALQSGTMTLLVGPKEEQITISRAFLISKSETFSKLIEKGDAVKLFVCWCYQERLQSIKPNASFKELEKWKVALIDLWIFAARYDIPKLQNQTMKALLALDLPQLLSKEDIRYVWDRTLSRSDALRDLAARVMVAQIEESSGQQKTIQDFKDVEGLDGLLAMVYTAHGKWLTYEMPRTKKDKRTKWMVFTQDPRVRQAFMVEERTQEVPQPQTKRRRTDGEAGPGLSGFPQVEVIEID